MRLIDADKVKIESRKHCINCTLNGTKHCKTCVVNLICDRLDLQPTVEPENKRALALIDSLKDIGAINNRGMGILRRAILFNENTRPQGKWILCNDSYFSKCSICGDLWLNEECNNYCPNCGAYMRSDNNGKK